MVNDGLRVYYVPAVLWLWTCYLDSAIDYARLPFYKLLA